MTTNPGLDERITRHVVELIVALWLASFPSGDPVVP
jgi:hypothetical protein